MFSSIEVPYGGVMLYNVCRLKEGVTVDDVEMALGEMCNHVKETYEGFQAGQVFEYAGFISEEGSVGDHGDEAPHIAIITFWESFEAHEESHRDELFRNAFAELEKYCSDTKELGYNLLWQGAKET